MSRCCERSRSRSSRCRRSSRRAAPLQYGFGKPATAAEIAGWDIDVRPDGTGLPQGPRLGRRGPGDLRREVRELPRHVRRIEQLPADRRRRRVARHRPADAHDRQQAQLRDDAVGLHQSRDAVQRAADADARRGLRADRVCAEPQRHRCPPTRCSTRIRCRGCAMPNRDGFTTAARLHDARRQARHAQHRVHEGLRAAKCGCPRRCPTTRATSTATSPSRCAAWARRRRASRARREVGPRPRQGRGVHGLPWRERQARRARVSGGRGALRGRRRRRIPACRQGQGGRQRAHGARSRCRRSRS